MFLLGPGPFSAPLQKGLGHQHLDRPPTVLLVGAGQFQQSHVVGTGSGGGGDPCPQKSGRQHLDTIIPSVAGVAGGVTPITPQGQSLPKKLISEATSLKD